MDTEKVVASCQSILEEFDELSECAQFEPCREPHKMSNAFWSSLSGFDELTKGMEGESLWKWVEFRMKHEALAFATGFVLGQTVNLLDKDTLDKMETVKEVIKEKALLPYFPREKKAAQE